MTWHLFHGVPNNFIPYSGMKVPTNCEEGLKGSGTRFPCKTHYVRKKLSSVSWGWYIELQLSGQAVSLSAHVAPGAMGALAPNGVLGCASNILHVAGPEPAVCCVCPRKALPLHK